MTPGDSLRCVGLRKAFDGVTALADVSLSFPSSGIVAIIGPNGAGKTTLLNVITGFQRPEAGRCYVGKRETTRMPPHRIAKSGIARTFQNLRLIRQISALDNVLLALPVRRRETLPGALFGSGDSVDALNRAEAQKALEFVGLGDKALELAGELSYGQQKLLTLACCVATQARILLLDEPVAGVHPEIVRRILDLLRQLRQQERLLVFIEHDIDAVRLVAEHVIVMSEGKVVAQGAPGDVLQRPEILEAYLV